MPDGRGWRFALEVAFLVALAVLLGIAQVGTMIIVLVMLAGWLLVALLEWAAWREEPHWGSGSPPRYYVPPASIPPRHPVDQRFGEQGYPAQREPEAPTWIATPEMRAAALGDWPVPAPVADDEPDEGAIDVARRRTRPAPRPLEAAAPVDEAAVDAKEPLEEALLHEASAAPGVEEAPIYAHEPAGNGADPWEVQSFPGEPVTEARRSTHRIDPLVESDGRRRPWRRGGEGRAATEFPVRPRHATLPRRGEDG